jgi:hypothetical protein
MKRTIVAALSALFLVGSLSAQPVSETQASAPQVIASTSWTAAFADLAGMDGVVAIAPPSLVHPPEYEITVKDVQKIAEAQYFVYAGYELMMKSMGDAIGGDSTEMIKINTDNSIATVEAETAKIAAIAGTEEESAARVSRYVQTVTDGKKAVEEAGLQGKKVLCHSMQVYLAKDLGLQIAGTFGPGAATAQQISDAAKNGYDIIIDNVHNPVAGPLSEVSPDSKVVVWRNFPDAVEPDALTNMVRKNIEALLGD